MATTSLTNAPLYPAASPLENRHVRPNRDPADYVYVDRYPALSDLLHFGGAAGVRYALVSAQRVGHYQSHKGYDLVARLPAITVRVESGLQAGDHAAMLMCLGKPIPTASPENGVRIFEIDPYLDDMTGLGPSRPAKSSTPKGAA